VSERPTLEDAISNYVADCQGWGEETEEQGKAEGQALAAELAELRRLSTEVTNLRNRVRFYESVMKGQPPHSHRGTECKAASAAGAACCNPKCNGHWGTGCWCCHYLEFASAVDDESIATHLGLERKRET